MTETHSGEVHHDRKATRAADTWGDQPMDQETALQLIDKLEDHGYDCRLTVEAKHEDSCVVKTIDSQDDADVTLGNIHLEEEYRNE